MTLVFSRRLTKGWPTASVDRGSRQEILGPVVRFVNQNIAAACRNL
jgi:hypothetical protein